MFPVLRQEKAMRMPFPVKQRKRDAPQRVHAGTLRVDRDAAILCDVSLLSRTFHVTRVPEKVTSVTC